MLVVVLRVPVVNIDIHNFEHIYSPRWAEKMQYKTEKDTTDTYKDKRKFMVHSMLKVLASTCVHNFPPHFSCDLTLPRITLITKYTCCIPSWAHKNCTAFRRLH